MIHKMSRDIYLLFFHLTLSNIWQPAIANMGWNENVEITGSKYLQSVIAQLQQDVHNKNVELTALDRIEREEEDSNSFFSTTHVPPPVPVTLASIKQPNKIIGPTLIPYLMNMTESESKVDSSVPAKISTIQIASDSNQMQPPPLSHDELVALYRAALAKSATLNWEEALQGLQLSHPRKNKNNPEPQGYYYYFYPIKKLQNNREHKVHPESSETPSSATHPGSDVLVSNSNVSNVKTVEPLFMAMTGFISMAVMFAASVLFLPKLTRWNLDGDRGSKVRDELASISNVMMDAFHGQDCTERLTCEFGRVARVLRFSDRPIRVLEILAPRGGVRNQLRAIRRYAWKKANCSMIACHPGENITQHTPLLISESNKIKTIILKDKSDSSVDRKPMATRISPSIKIISLIKQEKQPLKYNLTKTLSQQRINKIHNLNICLNLEDCKINHKNSRH